MVATTQSRFPTISGFFRPSTSLIGPAKSCPTAIPMVIMPMVIWIFDADVSSSTGIIGKAGKYISVANGVTAVSNPKNIINNNETDLLSFMLFLSNNLRIAKQHFLSSPSPCLVSVLRFKLFIRHSF